MNTNTNMKLRTNLNPHARAFRMGRPYTPNPAPCLPSHTYDYCRTCNAHHSLYYEMCPDRIRSSQAGMPMASRHASATASPNATPRGRASVLPLAAGHAYGGGGEQAEATNPGSTLRPQQPYPPHPRILRPVPVALRVVRPGVPRPTRPRALQPRPTPPQATFDYMHVGSVRPANPSPGARRGRPPRAPVPAPMHMDRHGHLENENEDEDETLVRTVFQSEFVTMDKGVPSLGLRIVYNGSGGGGGDGASIDIANGGSGRSGSGALKTRTKSKMLLSSPSPSQSSASISTLTNTRESTDTATDIRRGLHRSLRL